jgi:hypothetical protein
MSCPEGEGNGDVIAGWHSAWRERAIPVAESLFAVLERELDESGLQEAAKAAGEEEIRRVGADRLEAVRSGV